MAKDKIIKKFNQLSKEERLTKVRDKHKERLKGKIKGGSYAWDTEEERESARNLNKK